MNRDERITQLVLHMFTHQMAERIVDLEDENDKLLSELMRAKNELDPSRLESALRMYVSDLDYDIHKLLECDEVNGQDTYPDEVNFFLRCWETAGEV